jgi:putative Mg2+ transporter-C (MgtC) family protein
VGLGHEATAVLGTLMALLILHVMPLLLDSRSSGNEDNKA